MSNILHFGCPYFPYQGGSSVRLNSLVENMVNEHSLYLITPTPSSNSADDHPFSSVFRTSKCNSLLFDRDIFRYMKSISFDVVIIHNSRALTAWFLMYRWFFKHVKVVCEIHSFRENGYLTKEINGFLYRQCDHVVVLSHAAKEYLGQQYGADKVTIVYNGVDIKNLVREREYSAESGVTFAYVGSFHEWQGVFILAEALNSLGCSFLNSNKVYLVGGGPAYKDCLNKLTAELRNHPNLIYKGWSSRDEVNDILNVTDYLLAPRPSTLATETVVPLKVFESIEYKIPLIATPVGGLKEVFLPEGDGAIFTEDCSAASLAKMMSAPKNYMDYQQLLDNLDVLSARVPSWKAVSQIYSDLANSI